MGVVSPMNAWYTGKPTALALPDAALLLNLLICTFPCICKLSPGLICEAYLACRGIVC